MQILTYPIGLLVGSLTVAVDLGSTAPPARLLLDGKTACELTERRASCAVDLGTALKPHLLEAVKLGADGKVLERAARAVNVPGTASAEVRLFPECSPERKTCQVRFGWLHPDKKPIVSARLSIDGVDAPIPPDGKFEVPYDAQRGHIATLDLDFGGDDHVVVSDVVGPTRKAEVSAALRATPLVTDAAPAEVEKKLKDRGTAVQAVERGQAEVIFVVEQSALGSLDSLSSKRTEFLSQRLSTADSVMLVPANHPPGTPFPRYRARGEDSGPSLRKAGEMTRSLGDSRSSSSSSVGSVAQTDKTDWLLQLLTRLRGHGRAAPRAADATAAAGYALGASPRRRALVLLLGDEKDESAFSPADVRAYLADVGVPLVVWRLGNARDAWPDAVPVRNTGELTRSLSDVRTLLTRQVVVWAPPEVTLAELRKE